MDISVDGITAVNIKQRAKYVSTHVIILYALLECRVSLKSLCNLETTSVV